MVRKNRIREIQKHYHLTQGQFAVAFGTTQQAISRSKNNQKREKGGSK